MQHYPVSGRNIPVHHNHVVNGHGVQVLSNKAAAIPSYHVSNTIVGIKGFDMATGGSLLHSLKFSNKKHPHHSQSGNIQFII